MRVSISLTVEIDPAAWTLNYGTAGATNIRRDVQLYARSLVREQFQTVGVLVDAPTEGSN